MKITIEDVNDNDPRFDQSLFLISLSESHDVGLPFYVISADDADEGPNGRLAYELVSATPPGPFVVRPLSGELLLTEKVDFESASKYTLVVSATDQGILSRSADVTIEITVLDANDHQPRFDQHVYSASVDESAPPSTRVLQLTATDKDAGQNGRLTFSLKESADGK